MSKLPPFNVSTAKFSPCKNYRYILTRIWGKGDNLAMFVGLNPSTADEANSDPTVTRCVLYAQRWGYDGLIMTNIFAWRSTDPKALYAVPEPIGEENDAWLVTAAATAKIVVLAWGAHGAYKGRGIDVLKLLRAPSLTRAKLHFLKLTKEGYPGHPLYLKSSLKPIQFFVDKPWSPE
jgi:hypothetical protein